MNGHAKTRLTPQAERKLPHEAAAGILLQHGGKIWYGPAEFSPKWLQRYRPVTLQRRLVRGSRFTRFLEFAGFLPVRYAVVARFDADHAVLEVYGADHFEPMTCAAREISEAIGVEVRVVKKSGLVLAFYGGAG